MKMLNFKCKLYVKPSIHHMREQPPPWTRLAIDINMVGFNSGNNTRVCSTPLPREPGPLARIIFRRAQDDGSAGSPWAVFIDAGNGEASNFNAEVQRRWEHKDVYCVLKHGPSSCAHKKPGYCKQPWHILLLKWFRNIKGCHCDLCVLAPQR